MKKILITGGTGFLGSALIHQLQSKNHQITVLSRSKNKVELCFDKKVIAITDLKQLSSSDIFDVIVNLAGAPIIDKRWTDERKRVIRNSRIDLTEKLIKVIGNMDIKPELLISGSAIGYYGDQGDTVLTEQSDIKEDFSHQLCADWERAALQAEHYGVRVCLVRTGLVLGANGGLLKRMLLPFKMGLGGRLGNGRQWMSWIHLQDWVAIAELMITDTSMHGAYNATAPNPVTNQQFSTILASVLRRPTLLPLSAYFLKTLLGEMSELVLGSQRVLPERLTQLGFQFHHKDLQNALSQILVAKLD